MRQKGSKGSIYPFSPPTFGQFAPQHASLGWFDPTLPVIISAFLCLKGVRRLVLVVFGRH